MRRAFHLCEISAQFQYNYEKIRHVHVEEHSINYPLVLLKAVKENKEKLGRSYRPEEIRRQNLNVMHCPGLDPEGEQGHTGEAWIEFEL